MRRSDRARRARLTVNGDGEAVVVLPRRASMREAEMLVEQHADWLDRHVGRIRAQRATLAQRRPLGQGRILHVAGEARRVSTVDGPLGRPRRGIVEALPGQLIVRLGVDGNDEVALLDAWLRNAARTAITQRAHERASQMGVQPGRITIRDQKSRWASASRDGRLSFSWRLVLAPPEVLDAVVVHELAHLRIRGHDKAFWALVHRHAPATAAARRWLREHAHELRAALE